jgi:hypothetical protein
VLAVITIGAATALGKTVVSVPGATPGAPAVQVVKTVSGTGGMVNWWTYPLVVGGVLCTVTALLLLRRRRPAGSVGWGPRWRRPAALAAVLLIACQVVQSAVTTAVGDHKRLTTMDDYAPWGERQTDQRALVTQADNWPAYRTDPGRQQTVANDPMMVGGQGSQYYSSLTADVLSRTLIALGDGYTTRGRSLQSLDNPVTDAIFSVGARVYSPPDPHQSWWPQDGSKLRLVEQDAPPLVTVRSAEPTSSFGKSPFHNQELLLGADVYTEPTAREIKVQKGKGQLGRTPDGGYEVSPSDIVNRKPWITTSCPAGSEVFLYAPQYLGRALLYGSTQPDARFFGEVAGSRISAMQPLGTVPASGVVDIRLTPGGPGVIPAAGIGCLDTGKLAARVTELKADGATKVSVTGGLLGAGVHAELPAGTVGTAVLAVPRIAGWQCAVGGGAMRPAGEYLGLISVPLDGSATSVDCSFRPPGLRLGSAVGAAALLGLVGLAFFRFRRLGGAGRFGRFGGFARRKAAVR